MIFFKLDKKVRWSAAKNDWLQENRGISFELLIQSRFIGVESNFVKQHQKFMLFDYENYVWVVPYVENDNEYFLKTAFPSRKHTRKYLEEIR